jgi:hypothetical protein
MAEWTPPPRRFEARIVRSRFGYYAHCSYGVTRLGEPGGLPFAFTLKGIRRKVERLRRKVERDARPPVEVIGDG